MNDFPTHLTALLDDVAASINPTPNFDAVRAASVPVVSTGGDGPRRFRSAFGAAAACVVLLGGGVAAYQVAGDDPSAVVTSSELTEQELAEIAAAELAVAEATGSDGTGTSERDGTGGDRDGAVVPVAGGDGATTDDAAGDHETDHARTAELGDTKTDGDAIVQVIHGRAAPGEFVSANSDYGTAVVAANDDAVWEMALRLGGVPDGASVPVRVTFGRSDAVYEFVVERPAVEAPEDDEPKVEEPKDEEPKAEEPEDEEPKADEPKHEEPEPEDDPATIPFTVKLADSYNDATHMKQVFYGTAPAGAVVYAQSDWGSTHVTAGRKGGWELHFVLADVPDDTVVRVVVSANTGGAFEFDLVRAKPAAEHEPEPKPFTVQLGEGFLGQTPMKQVLYGTGTPGSGVLAATEFGSEDARVDENGHWEMLLKMYDVPAGTDVGVRVTNNQSESVFEFSLQRPAAEPDPVEFAANAVYEECGSEPPYNEYWGTSAAGSTISITSPYGNGAVTANGDGHWEARVEFPSAPIGETFIVKVTSSAGGGNYQFPLTRTA